MRHIIVTEMHYSVTMASADYITLDTLATLDIAQLTPAQRAQYYIQLMNSSLEHAQLEEEVELAAQISPFGLDTEAYAAYEAARTTLARFEIETEGTIFAFRSQEEVNAYIADISDDPGVQQRAHDMLNTATKSVHMADAALEASKQLGVSEAAIRPEVIELLETATMPQTAFEVTVKDPKKTEEKTQQLEAKKEALVSKIAEESGKSRKEVEDVIKATRSAKEANISDEIAPRGHVEADAQVSPSMASASQSQSTVVIDR